MKAELDLGLDVEGAGDLEREIFRFCLFSFFFLRESGREIKKSRSLFSSLFL